MSTASFDVPAPEAIIDQIYALATRLDGLTEVTGLLARHTRSRSCGLMIQDRKTFQVTGGWFSGIDLAWGLAYQTKFYDRDPTVVEHFQIPSGTAYASRHNRDSAEFRETAFFKEWCTPQKLGYFAGAYLELEGTQALRLTFQGDFKRGQYEPESLHLMQAVVPHLRRAVEINHRITQLIGHTRAFASVLEQSSNAIVLLNSSGEVIYSNSAAEQVRGKDLMFHGKRVHIANPEARKQFDTALVGCFETLRESDAAVMQSGVHVAIPRNSLLPLSVYIAPFRIAGASPQDPVPPDLVMLQIVDPEHQIVLDANRLREVMDLTPAEARVAAYLCRGESAQQIGKSLAISSHTVRDHMKHIYLRVGVSKQSELVARAYSVLRVPGTSTIN